MTEAGCHAGGERHDALLIIGRAYAPDFETARIGGGLTSPLDVHCLAQLTAKRVCFFCVNGEMTGFEVACLATIIGGAVAVAMLSAETFFFCRIIHAIFLANKTLIFPSSLASRLETRGRETAHVRTARLSGWRREPS